MKFLDFTSLLESEPASLAIFSTFQFDADFFERRLLRSATLAKARRILIFMDATQWAKMLGQDIPARQLNRRYLVVPVRVPRGGVFHPKLHLLVRDDGAQLHCGSNNLTRAGSTSNLELLNSINFSVSSAEPNSLAMMLDAYRFFQRVCDDAEPEAGQIAKRWLEVLMTDAPWLRAQLPPDTERAMRLYHTYDGSLWDRLAEALDQDPPKRVFIISPFFDTDAALLHRLRKRWTGCRTEVLVQQHTTTLPVPAVRGLGNRLELSELRQSSRRLHAKLVAWESFSAAGCLVGSANFTTAAFDARNVEACLWMPAAGEQVEALFDGHFSKRSLSLDDFEPGTEVEPGSDDVDGPTLGVSAALLTDTDRLRVSYWRSSANPPTSLKVAIRTPSERRPRVLLAVPNVERGTATLSLPDSALKDASGTILASLVAEFGERREESPPMWVIQEDRLSYEPAGDGSSSSKSRVEESGSGLTELLDEIGKRDGISALVEFLSHLNIRFHDGGAGRGIRAFRVRISDPFRADDAPDWLLRAGPAAADLTAAIYDFVDRHDKQRLRKHARNGNINGMENFLDIFTALVRLLYVYHTRGYVHRLKLIGRVCDYVEIATCGFENEQDSCDGYLYSVYDNLGDSDYLQEVCEELNYLGQIRAAFAIAQKLRFDPNETASNWGKPPKRPSECFPDQRKRLAEAIEDLGLSEPKKSDVIKALTEYNMFTAAELTIMADEIVW